MTLGKRETGRTIKTLSRTRYGHRRFNVRFECFSSGLVFSCCTLLLSRTVVFPMFLYTDTLDSLLLSPSFCLICRSLI